MNNKPELGMEVPDIREFLIKFSEIAEKKYAEFGLAGYIAITHLDTEGIFQTASKNVNWDHGRRGYGGGNLDAISKTISVLTGVYTREIINAVKLNDSCVICSVSDDGKGYPERNDERDAQIITSVLEEMSLE